MDIIDKFINWANENNWTIETNGQNINSLPDVILKRYNIPNEYKKFLEIIKNCISEDGNKWFLCINDYIEKEENEFRWNEYEIISIEAAADDDEWKDEIINFWDDHFPFFMGVEGEYEYYAINVNNGFIVNGCEPEFEETKIIAEYFYEFIGKIISGELKL
jgi:hypothetical protein